MTKVLLPVFVGVFVGAFVVELFRRNNPELAAAIEAKAKRAVRSLPRPRWPGSRTDEPVTPDAAATVGR